MPSILVAAAGQDHHISPVAKAHPHAEATYRVVALPDSSFGVEVSIPGSYPTTVSPFATEPDAEAWIAQHKSRVAASHSVTGWFRNQGSRGGRGAG